MNLILTSIEYSGTTTLAAAIRLGLSGRTPRVSSRPC
jgi:hypothetical protein